MAGGFGKGVGVSDASVIAGVSGTDAGAGGPGGSVGAGRARKGAGDGPETGTVLDIKKWIPLGRPVGIAWTDVIHIAKGWRHEMPHEYATLAVLSPNSLQQSRPRLYPKFE